LTQKQNNKTPFDFGMPSRILRRRERGERGEERKGCWSLIVALPSTRVIPCAGFGHATSNAITDNSVLPPQKDTHLVQAQ